MNLNLMRDPKDQPEAEAPAPIEPEREWKKAIPPWVLLALLSVCTTAIGWLGGKLDRVQDTANRQQEKQLAQLEQATKNARDVYVAGLSERVATVEADVRVLKDATRQTNDSIGRMVAEMKSLTVANERLATRVEFMTAQMVKPR